jgi:signal transduction histidine kinase
MMAGLAHELNNPLAIVLGNAELLDSHLDGPGRLEGSAIRREYVRPLLEEALRARSLVRDFLKLARQPDIGLSSVRLEDHIDMMARVRASAFVQAGLCLQVDGETGAWVRAHPLRLNRPS